MKKLIIILLFSVGIQAQVKTPDFIQKTVISGIIEIDGHESKSYLILETTLEGIRIYDRDTKKEYKLRKCSKDKCDIIHLEPKSDYTVSGSIRLAPYLHNNTATNGL